MPEPNDSYSLPNGVDLTVNANGTYTPSSTLIELLVSSRSGYDWPAGTGAAVSQKRILDLEVFATDQLAGLAPATAHSLVVEVSDWAGNNAKSHAQIQAATGTQQVQM